MKYHGKIGYAITDETAPGVWGDTITERNVIGDILKNVHKLENSEKVNQDINISNTISIVSDPYARANFRYIKYAIVDGVKWKVISVEVQYPRLILTLGGEYNDNTSAS